MIILVRHAHISGSRGHCIGRTSVPLSDKGVAQAKDLAEELRRIGFARLCSSPSERAMDTLAPLATALGMQPEWVPELDEIDMGEWDGLSFDEIRARFPDEYVERGKRFDTFRPKDGESFNDVADRAMAALNALGAGPQPVLAMTHVGVIRAVLCRLSGCPMNNLFNFSPGYTECALLRPMRSGLELVETGVQSGRVPLLLRSLCGVSKG